MRYPLITLICLSFYTLTNAQNCFWSEDFANGIPVKWEIDEPSEIGVSWSYCPDTTQYSVGNDATCPHEFNDEPNGFQTHFKSDSPENGYATCVLNPFLNEVFSKSFLVTLTTDSINCMGKENVYVIFNSHIGLFFNDTKGNIQLNVSTDKENWTSYTLHENLIVAGSTSPGFKRWSKNAEKITIDISEVAANEPAVFLQWSWTGNDEYHWSIDDIQLTDENPLPDLDLSLSPNSLFHAIMPNYKTPISQIDTAYFLTDVANFGKASQDNVEIRAQVINTQNNAIVYDEAIIIPTLRDSQIIEDVQFPPYFHTTGVGDFKITYSTDRIAEEENPEDNYFEYGFIITESEFSKFEPDQFTSSLFPLEFDQTNSIQPNWAIANHFFVPNGAAYCLDEVVFEIPNFEFLGKLNGNDIIVNNDGINVTVNLFEWNNVQSPNLATEDEYTLIASEEFGVTGSDGNESNTIKLESLFSDEVNIPLRDNQHYFLALDYSTTFNYNLFGVSANTSLNYDAMIQANLLAGKNRFAAMSKIGSTPDYNTLAFGGCVTPHIGFTINQECESLATNQTIIQDGIRVFPNPTDNSATIKFNFNLEKDASLELFSIDGSLVRSFKLSDNQTEIEINSSELPNANYLLTYKSEKVISSTKLVVLH